MKPQLSLLLLLGLVLSLNAQTPEPLQRSIAELRESIGLWQVETDFLGPDGSVIRTLSGSYEFSWVVEDRVIIGKNQFPEINQASGILFYINPVAQTIEMVSVGGDGKLWIMTGPLGSDQRQSQAYQAADGKTRQLRFTRFNVSKDAFESKMEITDDQGATWTPGNHQRFKRIKKPQGK